MPFHEKKTWAMLFANIFVYGWYFSRMVNIAVETPLDELPIAVAVFASDLVITVITLIVVAIIAHIVIALHSMKAEGEVSDTEDERDQLIELRAGSIGEPILGLGVVITIGMILLGNGPFVTANTLLAALVLSETVKGIFKIIYYRRSF